VGHVGAINILKLEISDFGTKRDDTVTRKTADFAANFIIGIPRGIFAAPFLGVKNRILKNARA
jgi:hypothetical protein